MCTVVVASVSVRHLPASWCPRPLAVYLMNWAALAGLAFLISILTAPKYSIDMLTSLKGVTTAPALAATTVTRPSRRHLLLQLASLAAANLAPHELAAKAVAESSTDDWAEQELTESLVALPAAQLLPPPVPANSISPCSKIASRRDLLHKAAAAAPPLPLPAGSSPSLAQEPEVLQIASAAELHRTLAAHAGRLVVAHVSAEGCPFGAAFAPWLAESARRFPAALFLHVAAEAHPAAEGDQPLAADTVDLGTLPCTLLLQNGQLLQRLELVGSSLAGSLDANADLGFDDFDATVDEAWEPAVEAAAAARLLHAALLGTLVRVRLLHADCARPANVYA